MIRIIAGIVVFFIPTIVNLVLGLGSALNIVDDEQYKVCTSCIFEANSPLCQAGEWYIVKFLKFDIIMI